MIKAKHIELSDLVSAMEQHVFSYLNGQEINIAVPIFVYFTYVAICDGFIYFPETLVFKNESCKNIDIINQIGF